MLLAKSLWSSTNKILIGQLPFHRQCDFNADSPRLSGGNGGCAIHAVYPLNKRRKAFVPGFIGHEQLIRRALAVVTDLESDNSALLRKLR